MSDEQAALLTEIDFDFDQETEQSRLVSILFFEYANQTPEQKLNIVGIFDRMYVDKEAKKTFVFGVFVRTAKAFGSPVFVSILSPEKKAVGGFSFSGTHEDGEKYSMFQMLARVQFETPVEGKYWFNVAFEGKSIGGCPLLIEFRDLKGLVEGLTRGDA